VSKYLWFKWCCSIL